MRIFQIVEFFILKITGRSMQISFLKFEMLFYLKLIPIQCVFFTIFWLKLGEMFVVLGIMVWVPLTKKLKILKFISRL